MYALVRYGLTAVLLLAGACHSDEFLDMTVVDMAATDQAVSNPFVERPYALRVPAGYNASKPAPLIILLHGYTLNGADQEKRFALGKVASEQGLLYAIPDGTKDENGFRFWNATDGCCDQFGAKTDDVAYLRTLIRDISSRYNVDAKRIFLVGHSNGGFMAYRMACDAADLIAGVVSLAGATWKDAKLCKPSGAVAVLQVHGDTDVVIKYGGGRFASNPGDYPGARTTVAQWAQNNGCAGALADAGTVLDLDDSVAGTETLMERYAGCSRGAVELWTMKGSGHFPDLRPAWGEQILKFLSDHPKP